ncbi:MAG: IclR family transcriptional regulator [Acetobacteraceae bacterium]|nr:IclR family transcriptional regulator [Acetobacteraceae bacterium]
MPKNSSGRPPARETTGPRSLTRLLGLFDALAKSSNGLTLAELNSLLESPKSSLLNLLRPLVAEGYLNHDNGRYRLGPTIFRLAGNIMSVWNFSNVIRPYLEELAQRSHESVYIGVLDRAGKAITYVDSIDSPHAVRYSVPIGGVRPLYCTAAGRILLAFADEEFQEEYLRTTKLEAQTERTLTTRKGLRAELDKVIRTRVSVSIGEMFPESAAIAAPIFGANGKIVAAMAVGGPSQRLQPKLDVLMPIIADVATRASGIAARGAAQADAQLDPVVAGVSAGTAAKAVVPAPRPRLAVSD